ncbi:ubiquitin carboxyl-terminal hydrolase 1-like [Dorcoceras hygrometricum]|uniref:Ubiquitin carboxyl-terminal hydrolase 1-like n=1 Tax=Dorcoceras hygrometricum TaxID=472368 RepID=A0A2Z7CA60_9LAMI|nr:ubiquitin carboxyl-terminal hydrolase 1-like [Dorcoceras hygrometricum]
MFQQLIASTDSFQQLIVSANECAQQLTSIFPLVFTYNSSTASLAPDQRLFCSTLFRQLMTASVFILLLNSFSLFPCSDISYFAIQISHVVSTAESNFFSSDISCSTADSADVKVAVPPIVSTADSADVNVADPPVVSTADSADVKVADPPVVSTADSADVKVVDPPVYQLLILLSSSCTSWSIFP